MLLYFAKWIGQTCLWEHGRRICLQNATSIYKARIMFMQDAKRSNWYKHRQQSNRKYTKVSGLAEVFVAQVGYDTATSTLVIAYTNSNIDLIKMEKLQTYPIF